MRKNRAVVERLLNVTQFLGKLSLPFRGHRDDELSQNKGLFREFVAFLSEKDEVLREHLMTAPGKCNEFGIYIKLEAQFK